MLAILIALGVCVVYDQLSQTFLAFLNQFVGKVWIVAMPKFVQNSELDIWDPHAIFFSSKYSQVDLVFVDFITKELS